MNSEQYNRCLAAFEDLLEDNAGYFVLLTLVGGAVIRGATHKARVDGLVRIDSNDAQHTFTMVAVNSIQAIQVEP
jgi:hypothetical protein